jgi:hypothetical protein
LGAFEESSSREPTSRSNGSIRALSTIFNIVFVPSDYSWIRKMES